MHEAFEYDAILTDYRSSVLNDIMLISVEADQI